MISCADQNDKWAKHAAPGGWKTLEVGNGRDVNH